MYKDKSWLYNKYYNEKLSLLEISKICNVTPMSIKNWMVKFNIPRRSISEANTGNKNGSFKGGIIEDYRWVKQCCNTKLSQRDIAKKAGTSHRTVVRWLRIHGLETQKIPKHNVGKDHPNWSGKSICKCGNKKNTKSKRCRLCFVKDNSGPNNCNWKGVADIMVTVRGRIMSSWRIAVFEKDNYACQKCGDNKGGNLNAHHKVRLSDIVNNLISGLDLSTPELRYIAINIVCSNELVTSIENGQTLCEVCHRKVHRKSH